MKLTDFIRHFIKGAFRDTLFEGLEREADEMEELLLLLVNLHMAGFENPFGYFSLQLLPYLDLRENLLARIVAKEGILFNLMARFEGWA